MVPTLPDFPPRVGNSVAIFSILRSDPFLGLAILPQLSALLCWGVWYTPPFGCQAKLGKIGRGAKPTRARFSGSAARSGPPFSPLECARVNAHPCRRLRAGYTIPDRLVAWEGNS